MKKVDLWIAPLLIVFAVSCSGAMTPKAGKIYDPAEVSASCAGQMQLDGATAMSLSTAFSETNGYITDEFRQKAAKDISMSPSVTPDERDQVLNDYLSCLESNAAQ